MAIGMLPGCGAARPDQNPPPTPSGSASASTDPGSTGGPGSTGDPEVRARDAQQLLDRLIAAARTADRSDFDAIVADRGSTFAARLYANLVTLSGEVRLHAESRSAELPAAERSRYPGGWAQLVTTSTRVAHDTGDSTYAVWLVMAPGSAGARLVGVADDPSGAPAERPLWLTQQVRVVTGPTATVLAGSRTAGLGTWLDRAATAERAVRAWTGDLGDRRWGSGLVVELPSTMVAFEQTLGVRAGSYDRIAAVAWPEGPDPATAAVRVVVNPELAAGLDDDRLAVLITHEATHVLTRSAGSPAPMWLVEGVADWIAFDRVPAAAPATEDLVLADVRRHGPPASLPSDAGFRPDADDLDLTYGRSWLLCRFIADSWSGRRLIQLYAAVDGGTPVETALREVLGTDADTLLRRWQSRLEQQARR